ncbi:unnamed protein product [Larinioides sclopetarius]|uniref:Uncharacterized protein n=1 Tax=Larinioides sclopetarius TaxID=280406 RepID=A0AAV2BLX5_9ARAC
MACASYTDVLQLDLEKKIQIGDVPSKDFPNLNCSHQELSEADGKTGSPIDAGSSSAKGFQAVPETCTIVETGLAEFTQDHSVHEATPQKALSITETLSKETSSGEDSVFTQNQMNFSMGCCNCKHHSVETVTTDKNCLAHSQKTTSIENVSVSLDISESGDANQASCCKSGPFSSFEMDASTFIAKHIKFPDYQRDCDIYLRDANFRRLVLENPEAFCDGHAVASHNTPCTHNSPTSDLPSVSSNKQRSTEESKRLDQALNPTYFSGKSSSKSLSETMKDLENWAIKGIENAFNTPLKTCPIDVKANLVKEFGYGLNLMQEIILRIHNLMRAASTLPVPPTVPIGGFEGGWDQILYDLNYTALAMWETVHDIRIEAFHDCKTLNLVPFHLSEKRTKTLNCKEQIANLNILITNTCNLVTERLPSLWKQMRDFREKIRIFCSEMDELL